MAAAHELASDLVVDEAKCASAGRCTSRVRTRTLAGMPIAQSAGPSRRAFMLGAGGVLLAACGVMRQVQSTEVLIAAPPEAAWRPVLRGLIPAVLAFDDPDFPALQLGALEDALLAMFPIHEDPELADVRSMFMLFDACRLFDPPPAPFLVDAVDSGAVEHERRAYAGFADRFGSARFIEQPLPGRRAYLALWGQSALPVRRRIYRGFRGWVLVSAYAQPELWTTIGYDGPLLERG